jgi:hypothetical protein
MTNDTRSEVTIIGSGGGQGLFGVDWGAQWAEETTIAAKIRHITEGNAY